MNLLGVSHKILKIAELIIFSEIAENATLC